MPYFYILMVILLTVYGQLVIKWQTSLAGVLPDELAAKIEFLIRLLLNPWVISGFFAALLATLFWMAAISRLQLSHAYPFISMTFVLVMIASGIFFHEPMSTMKVVGALFIVAGIAISSQG
ncbi:MAG: EamA family transporter [Gallionella sp.]|nr:EamA family transporter [Gallionella sp.]